jgi:hypothetical protein
VTFTNLIPLARGLFAVVESSDWEYCASSSGRVGRLAELIARHGLAPETHRDLMAECATELDPRRVESFAAARSAGRDGISWRELARELIEEQVSSYVRREAPRRMAPVVERVR